MHNKPAEWKARQHRLDAVREKAQPQSRKQQRALFVQMVALVFDQPALGPQEGVGFPVAGAGKRHFGGRWIISNAARFGAVAGLFLCHLAPQPNYANSDISGDP
jgi:hypothetical protein